MGDLISRSELIKSINEISKSLFNEWDTAGVLSVVCKQPTVEAVPVVHGEWVDGVCSVCKTEAFSTSWDEAVYDYDWEENLYFSHIESHIEQHLTDFCPNCGADMRKAV